MKPKHSRWCFHIIIIFILIIINIPIVIIINIIIIIINTELTAINGSTCPLNIYIKFIFKKREVLKGATSHFNTKYDSFFITKCHSFFITKCDSFFITKCNSFFITKCDHFIIKCYRTTSLLKILPY